MQCIDIIIVLVTSSANNVLLCALLAVTAGVEVYTVIFLSATAK